MGYKKNVLTYFGKIMENVSPFVSPYLCQQFLLRFFELSIKKRRIFVILQYKTK